MSTIPRAGNAVRESRTIRRGHPDRLFIVLALLGVQLELDLNAASHMLASFADSTMNKILRTTGNA
jgi:hypothetical protein